MPKNVIQYDLLISCPGDIKEEVEIINNTVQKFNDQFSDTLGISIRTRHWSKNSYPQSGDKPQSLLNKQLVENCDAAVALFWTRFGTPTDQYDSGTEEEIEIMLEAEKQVFLYFSENPVPPSKMDSEGYAKVQALKQKYRERGIYFTYTTMEEFERQFYAHLTQYFIKKASDDTQPKRSPQLVPRGIDANGKLCEDLTVLEFRLNSSNDLHSISMKIKELYQNISSMHVAQRTPTKGRTNEKFLALSSISMQDSLQSAVTIDEDTKEVITSVAENLKITLADDFFDLGNLHKNATTISTLRGERGYSGTEKEILKYESIMKLHDSIFDFINWATIEKAYTGLPCIKLAIENNGTAIDKDIEIGLRFNKDLLLQLDKFPAPQKDFTIKFLLDECDFKSMMSIPPTAQYKAYEDSMQPGSSLSIVQDPSFFNPFVERDYQEEYRNSIARIFYCYEIFTESNNCILKVKFDYIKHHTVVAFPTPIFLQQIPTEVEYTITSQNSPNILSGRLSVRTI